MYARGNPMKYNDPTGHCVEDLCIGEGALLAAGCVASGLCEKVAEAGSALLAEGSTLLTEGAALAVEAADALGLGAETTAAAVEKVATEDSVLAEKVAENGVGQVSSAAEKVAVDKNLVDQLLKEGVKHNPDNILRIGQTSNGRIVFLETGNNAAGFQHIINEHANDFTNRGIATKQIPDLLMKALSDNKIVGFQGAGTGRPIYETIFNGVKQLVAITVGNNGYIVGANPASVR